MRIRFEPNGITQETEAGLTVLEAAIAAGVEIKALCGGRGTCGKCKVIAPHGLTPLTSTELDSLTDEERAAGYRLACQASVVDDVNVIVPEESRISRVSILSDGIGNHYALDPWVKRYNLTIPAATLESQVCDLENVHQVMAENEIPDLTMNLTALRELPNALRADEGRITLTAVDDEIVAIEAGPSGGSPLGIAFDIGTTTVVGYLLDLESGDQLAVSSLLNPQTRYGDDVVSRIDHIAESETGLSELQEAIVKALNRIIKETTTEAGVSPRRILAMTVVGNTTMQHLLLSIDPSALARSPYVPAVTRAVCLSPHELGIDIHPGAHIWVLPNIAGWVGADTVGVLLATDLQNKDELALAIDIGTNGEMAMGSRQRVITCSTAAGPAFEGAHLSCGMRAADGAIDTVTIGDDVVWHTIGESAPRGVCGSGLVDLIAEMLNRGILRNTGLMQDGGELEAAGRPALGARIEQKGRARMFTLVKAEQGANGRPVLVTQRDVRELQLAKGAIRAGIEILLREIGASHRDVNKVYLAGAFGNYIKPSSALRIGLIPDFPNAEIVPVGNAAGAGAKMALLSKAARAESNAILENTEYIELSGRADFQEHFSEAMLF